MIIKKEHAISLLNILEKDKEKAHFVVGAEKDLGPYIELELQNFARMEKPMEYTLTYWGKGLADLLVRMMDKGLIPHPESWDPEFRWIGTEVIVMIESALSNNNIPGELTEKELEKRGFVREEKIEGKGNVKVINGYAKDLYDIFKNAKPRLVVSRELYNYIQKTPTGPARFSLLPQEERFPLLLESMRLIALSVPTHDIYTFTGLGQAVKETCNALAASLDTVISEDIMYSLVKLIDEGAESLTEEEMEVLGALAYIDGEGNILPAGEALLTTYQIWKEKEFKPVKTFDIDILDAEVLKSIDSIWEKRKDSPNILPTINEIINIMFLRPIKEYKHLFEYYGRRIYQDIGYHKKEEIRKKFDEVKTIEEVFKSYYEKGGKWDEKIKDVIQHSLYTLESFNLIVTGQEEGKKIYTLTEFGKKVVDDLKRRGVRNIPSSAVKAITISYREFSSPNVSWYEEAKERHLVGTGEPTEAGKLYANLAYDIERLPHLTRFELRVLHRIPERGFFVKDVYNEFDETWQEEIQYALGKLEARGYIEILQNEAIILTEPGKLIKRALSGVPESMANPITPLVVKILKALYEVGGLYTKEKKIRVLPKNMKEALRITGLDPETFDKELIIARKANLIGKTSVNEAGLLVLQSIGIL